MEKKRLELKFRPDDVYAKGTFGDKSLTTGILLKVKVRKYKDGRRTENVDVLGNIASKYKFDCLCDFQYLPVLKKSNEPNEKAEFIYNEVVPSGILPVQWLDEHRNNPFYLPPLSFTRLDTVQETIFKKDQMSKDQKDDSTLIGRTRMRRNKHATYLLFDLQLPTPTHPHPIALDFLKTKFIPQEKYDEIRELFQKRPIWSKMAITFEANVSSEHIKVILPAVSYYYTSGPWRVMWVRYGYDPRKDFESRYFQTFDYRLKNMIGMKNYVKLKRGNTNHKINTNRKMKNSLSLIDGSSSSQLGESTSGGDIGTKKSDRLYIPYFESGMCPQSRQTFYQYCDLRVPKIQEMLDKIPTPLSGAVCNEKSGWLPARFDDLCREIITEDIREQLQSVLNRKEEESFENDDEEDEYMSEGEEYDEGNLLEEQIEDMDLDEN